jgi:hypothetical protein
MCGTANQTAIDEMLHYAHETQKEKIIRSLSVGLALVMYRREESADALIDRLVSHYGLSFVFFIYDIVCQELNLAIA